MQTRSLTTATRRKLLLSRLAETAIFRGARFAISLDPEKVLDYVEEELTSDEHTAIHDFLAWVVEDEPARRFGHRSYAERVDQYLQTLGGR